MAIPVGKMEVLLSVCICLVGLIANDVGRCGPLANSMFMVAFVDIFCGFPQISATKAGFLTRVLQAAGEVFFLG